MITSPPTSTVSKPTDDDRIPRSTLGYFQARNKHRIYELVLETFLKSNISQATLARRLGKGTDQICRWLGAPGNWSLDTVSDLIFAIDGGEVDYGIGYPLERHPRNMRRPDWAESPTVIVSRAETSHLPPPPDFIQIDYPNG